MAPVRFARWPTSREAPLKSRAWACPPWWVATPQPPRKRKKKKQRRLTKLYMWGKLRIFLGLGDLSRIPIADSNWALFPGRSILARKWLAKMTKTHPASRCIFFWNKTFKRRHLCEENSANRINSAWASRPQLGLVVRCGDLAQSQIKNASVCVFSRAAKIVV